MAKAKTTPTGEFPPGFDPVYFMAGTWAERLAEWRTQAAGDAFAGGNEKVVTQLLLDPNAGLRAVVNITNAALLGFLNEEVYRNLYEHPMIGDAAQLPTQTRFLVDDKLDLGDSTYFAAVALGGAGVGYYGEYCIVLERGDVLDGARLFDRDSYDILEPPLISLDMTAERIERLRGKWQQDLEAMVAMKVLPGLAHDRRLATTGTISEAILRDQEFIEVHMCRTFSPEDVEEIREAPEEVAIEAHIGDKHNKGRHVSAVEAEWVRRRDLASNRIDERQVRARVVTTHGRGYQWA